MREPATEPRAPHEGPPEDAREETPASSPNAVPDAWLRHVGGSGRFDVRVNEDTRIARMADAPRDAFERAWGERLVSRQVETFRFLDGGLFLKCRRVPSWGDGEALRESGRIVNEAGFLERMRDAGVRVPVTLAWGREVRYGVPVRSFLLTRVVPDTRNLSEFVLGTEPGDPGRLAVLEGVGAVVRRLHGAGLYHRDLTTRNLLVEDDGGLLVIDCPRGIANHFAPRRAALARGEFLRLGRSLLREGATDAEMRALLHAAGVENQDALLRAIRRRLTDGRGRSWRTRVWVMTGL